MAFLFLDPAVGKLVFSPQVAEARSEEGVILVRENTSPEDVGGMWAAQGILTSRGGVTSHAAVVARGYVWGPVRANASC